MTLVGSAGRVTGSLKLRASRAAGAITVVIAAVALAGLWGRAPWLASWGAGLPSMWPPGALCLLTLGLALMVTGRGQRLAIAAAGTAAALLTTLLLGAAMLHVDGGIELLALRSPVPTPDPDGPVFRIAHTSTLVFGLLGLAFAFSLSEKLRLTAAVIAGLAAAIPAIALLSYLSGIDTLYGTAASLASPPLPTVVGQLCLAAGILLRIGAIPALHTPRPLRHLLAFLGCAIIVPLLLFGAYAEISIADAQLGEMRKGLMVAARALSAEIDREIMGEIERLKALAASPSLRQGDFAAFQSQAEASLALRQSGDLILVDRNMQEIVDTGTPYGLAHEKATVPEALGRAMMTGKPQFTDLFTVSGTGQVMFGIIVPVSIDGQNRYALMRSLSRHALAEPIAADKLPAGWQAVISSASHRVLAQSQQDGAPADVLLPAAQLHGAAPSGVFEFIDAKGQPALEAYADSALTGWETAVWEPKALLEAPIRTLWRTLGWLALLSAGLVTGLALWLGRVIANSVGHVASHAAAGFVAGGLGPAARPQTLAAQTPVAEVNALMAHLREAAEQRQRAEDMLRASERQLRLVSDNVPVAIVRCDADGCCTFANKLFMERRRLTSDDIVGRHLSDVIGDRDFASIERYVTACVAGEAVEFEFDTDHRAGETLCLQARFAPEWRDGMVVGLIGATTDITRLKQAERRLHANAVTFRHLVDDSPFGVYVVDADLRLVQASIGARRTFASVQPLIGRDLTEVLQSVWREPFASEAISRFRHALASGEPYHAPRSVQRRKDTDAVESHDWRIERLAMPDGRCGVVCHFYDLSERENYEQELEASRTRLQLVLDAAKLGWFQYDPARRSGAGDARFREIFDLAAAETPVDQLMERVHPDDVERVRSNLAASLDPVHPEPAVVEYRIQRRDGELHWVEIHGLAYFEGEGPERRAVSLIGTVQDITDRKRHEEQTQLLMHEVNHRAKNMLSVVDAIAHQTATRSPEDFISRFSERIQALSANQDLLVRNDWNGVLIAELVRAQLAHFSDLIGTRIMMRGPRLRLKAASAQAIGLALHELATNAGKYGALSTEAGCVSVQWRIEDDRFQMSWTECKGPPVTPPKRHGFGTIVMEVMAERTVGGKVDLDYAPSGVRWRLTCPAVNALEGQELEPAERVPA